MTRWRENRNARLEPPFGSRGCCFEIRAAPRSSKQSAERVPRDAKITDGRFLGVGAGCRADHSRADRARASATGRGFDFPLLRPALRPRKMGGASALGLGLVSGRRRPRLAALHERPLGVDAGIWLVLGVLRAVRLGHLSLRPLGL